MTNVEILKIDGVEYDHQCLVGFIKQSPDVKIKVSDIEIFGVDIDSNKFNSKEYSVKVNSVFENNEISVFNFFGKTILLTGYNRYIQAKQAGKLEVSAKLVSKPVLKKARFEVFIKPSFLGKTTTNVRRSYRADFRDQPEELLGQEVSQQKSSRLIARSRQRESR